MSFFLLTLLFQISFRLSQSDPLKSIIRSFNLSNSCFISVKSTLKPLHFYFLLSMLIFIFLFIFICTLFFFYYFFFFYIFFILSFNFFNSCFISVKFTLNPLHFYFLLSMTMFIFLSTSTWTWIISSNIFFSYKWLSLFLRFTFA